MKEEAGAKAIFLTLHKQPTNKCIDFSAMFYRLLNTVTKKATGLWRSCSQAYCAVKADMPRTALLIVFNWKQNHTA